MLQERQQDEVRLIRCQVKKCREPLARLAPGSSGEIKCPKCGVKTPVFIPKSPRH